MEAGAVILMMMVAVMAVWLVVIFGSLGFSWLWGKFQDWRQARFLQSLIPETQTTVEAPAGFTIRMFTADGRELGTSPPSDLPLSVWEYEPKEEILADDLVFEADWKDDDFFDSFSEPLPGIQGLETTVKEAEAKLAEDFGNSLMRYKKPLVPADTIEKLAVQDELVTKALKAKPKKPKKVTPKKKPKTRRRKS